MDRSADQAIERAKVREVAAVFHSPEALEAAVEDLLEAGFDRADMDRLGDLDELRKRLGPVYVAHEELADLPQAPRQPVLLSEDIATTMVVVVSVLASFGGVIAALLVFGFRGGTVAAVITGLLAAAVAGGIGALLTWRFLKPPRSRALEAHLAERGIVLWVRTRSPDLEDKAQEILHLHGGTAIRIHEVELDKTPEDIPLSSLRPDPWLGDERLGRP